MTSIKPLKNKIKAVFFDLDGTLYSSSRFNLLCFPYVLFKHPLLFLKYNHVRKLLHQAEHPFENIKLSEINLLSQKANISKKRAEDFIDNFIHDQLDSLLQQLKPYPFINEMLQKLLEKGLVLGIVSDFPLGKKLEYLNIEKKYFHYLFSSMEINGLKPSKIVFEEIAKLSGFPNEAILYVGNSYRYDVMGAKRCNFQSAYFTKKPKRETAVDDFRFSDYKELLQFILSYS